MFFTEISLLCIILARLVGRRANETKPEEDKYRNRATECRLKKSGTAVRLTQYARWLTHVVTLLTLFAMAAEATYGSDALLMTA